MKIAIDVMYVGRRPRRSLTFPQSAALTVVDNM